MVPRAAGALLGAVFGAMVALLAIIAWATASESAATLGGGERLSNHGIETLTLLGAGGGLIAGFLVFGSLLERASRELRLTRLATELHLQRATEARPNQPSSTAGGDETG